MFDVVVPTLWLSDIREVGKYCFELISWLNVEEYGTG